MKTTPTNLGRRARPAHVRTDSGHALSSARPLDGARLAAGGAIREPARKRAPARAWERGAATRFLALVVAPAAAWALIAAAWWLAP